MTGLLFEKTATQLLASYASGEVSPVDVVQSCLERIEQLDPVINAIRLLRADEAVAEAKESEARWASGTAGALDGVPFGLKDIIATAGVTTTGGSARYIDHVPDETAAHAQRLMDAGGILLAKLETFEFACGGPHNRTFGAVANPWDVERTTGGSSSGSGAAVAAQMMPLAIGTDTGGSVRIPAAYCGLTGLKPTYGRVPRHGVMGLSWTLDHAGPMARSVADAALMLSVIAGHDARDAASSPAPVPDYLDRLDQSLSGVRVGRLRGRFEDNVDPDVMAAHDNALEALADSGAQVVDVEMNNVDHAIAAAWQIMYPEMLSLHEAHFDQLEDRDMMGANLLASTPFVSAVDYLRALRYRSIFQASFDEAIASVDALALPGLAQLPPRLDELVTDDQVNNWLGAAVELHIPFNYTGTPALCLPAGTARGMPTSLQLVGRPHRDDLLLSIGHRFQSSTAFHLATPILQAPQVA